MRGVAGATTSSPRRALFRPGSPGGRSTTRAITGILGCTVCVLLLAGCAGQDPRPTTLTFSQKIARWEAMSRANWLIDTQNVSAKSYPDLAVRTVSAGAEWRLDVSECLEYENTGATTADDARFICRARHPRAGDLDGFLSDSQASVLYDYYVDSLQPCLLMAGQPISTPPSRARFLAQNREGLTWTPWQSSRLLLYGNPQDSAKRYHLLQKQCPPAPKW